MTTMFDLVFSTPSLQNIFSRATDNDQEIGGWLLCTDIPDSWPIRFSWRNIRKAINSPNGLLFIESFVIIPNEASNPDRAWSAWDYPKAKEVATQTASAYGAWPIHFHTHPGEADPAPSYADIGFAGANCQDFPGHSHFAIVTHAPFRIWLYQLTWGTLGTPHGGRLQVSQFISWRQKRMRKFRRRM
jgi:hypothetical protein